MAKARAQKSPNDARAQLELARAARASNSALAARALRAAIKLDPDLAEAYRELADLYEQYNYTDRLIELLEARLKQAPDEAETMVRLATLYTQVQAVSEAQALMDRVAARAADDERIVMARALFYYKTGQFGQGSAVLQNYLSRHPQNDSVLYRLSETQRADGKFADAEASIREAIRLKPDNGLYVRQLAHILITSDRAERFSEAEREARRALALGDTSLDGRYWLAVAIDKQKRAKEAIAAYEDVAREDIRYDKTAYRLGRLYQENGRADEGSKLLTLYRIMERNRGDIGQAVSRISKHPEQSAHYGRLAKLYQMMEENGLAVALLRHALRRFPEDTALRRQLREALLKAGRKTEAAKLTG